MKKCKDIENLFYFYLSGEINGREKKFMEDHLHECPSCAEELNAFKRTLTLLDGKDTREPGADYFNNFTAETLNKIRALEKPAGVKQNLRFYLRPAIALLVLFSVIFTAKQISNYREQSVIHELEIARNMELYQNMEIIENIDEIEKL